MSTRTRSGGSGEWPGTWPQAGSAAAGRRWNFLRTQREEHTEKPSPDRIVLVAALAKIPAQLRKAMVLYYIGELSIAEIAAQEDVAEGTVKSWLSPGRAALGEQLAERKEGRSHV